MTCEKYFKTIELFNLKYLSIPKQIWIFLQFPVDLPAGKFAGFGRCGNGQLTIGLLAVHVGAVYRDRPTYTQ